jgi:hypothetical protein
MTMRLELARAPAHRAARIAVDVAAGAHGLRHYGPAVRSACSSQSSNAILEHATRSPDVNPESENQVGKRHRLAAAR